MCSLKHQPAVSAVHPLLDIPDPLFRLLGVVVTLDLDDNVGVVRLAALHLAEHDVPIAVTAWIGWAVCASPDWTKPHRIAGGLVEDGAAVNEVLRKFLIF